MHNVGSVDRAIRLILGLVLLLSPFLAAGSFAGLGAWRYAIAAVGLVLIATAAFRFCPAYRLLGIQTCARR
ncbi:YgaP family membrane protein [Falsiroseomonas tokyonensis]|uniref:DUF2892 domain-containing protein n=1 Tax=Falsiroseomonas tokyonensis TaxID=430521 RepID=A0ABV7BZK0_9PROT|nr:DUF2892 domain-containing protein [Falsiroseomonas tokyonensis]MBU8540682.1 DUF2892 domain-containing protein [Falsiroseomonas tokyonensis]